MSQFDLSRRNTASAALWVLAAGCGVAMACSPASAEQVNNDPGSRIAVENGYWTPERIMNAKPLDLTADIDASRAHALLRQNVTPVPSVRGEGAPPSIDIDRALEEQVAPAIEPSPAPIKPEARTSPSATSSEGAYFTTYRVFPQAAVTSYPNSVAGKVLFSDPRTGGNFFCSASVLRPRVVVLAGHCTAHPSTTTADRYFYHNFLFIPAYDNGTAPFGKWTPKVEYVTATWINSNGSVPNAQDVSMWVMNDQVISGTTQKIGSVVGYLGYLTGAISDNNVTMLGYPCNLDSCTLMELTNAQTYGSGGSNTYIYGSAMRGGASGGPWLQDYGNAPAGSPAPSSKLGQNYLVAVTSYGPTAAAPEWLGASVLDGEFLTLVNDACNQATGNC